MSRLLVFSHDNCIKNVSLAHKRVPQVVMIVCNLVVDTSCLWTRYSVHRTTVYMSRSARWTPCWRSLGSSWSGGHLPASSCVSPVSPGRQRLWPRHAPGLAPRLRPPGPLSTEPRPPLSESLFVNNQRYFRKSFIQIQKSLAKNRNCTSRTYRIISAANRDVWIKEVAFLKVLSTLPRKTR